MCLLQLSLKMPKFFGLYYSKSQLRQIKSGEPIADVNASCELSLRSIRFNVAWNIWREVAECGVFLIPFFLTGEGIKAIPLSAVIGSVVGAVICFVIYWANRRFKSTVGLTIFTVSLFLLLSTGLFSGGCVKFEMVFGSTPVVWSLNGDFWSVNRLPMTVFKPFGYTDKRTVLGMVCFWVWLMFGLLLHYCKFKKCYIRVGLDEEVGTKGTEFTPETSTATSTGQISMQNSYDGTLENGNDLESERRDDHSLAESVEAAV
jgi:high-affinity iron transporter